MFLFFVKQVHKLLFYTFFNIQYIVNLDYSPKQTEVQGLRSTIEWINRKGWHNLLY